MRDIYKCLKAIEDECLKIYQDAALLESANQAPSAEEIEGQLLKPLRILTAYVDGITEGLKLKKTRKFACGINACAFIGRTNADFLRHRSICHKNVVK